MIPDIAISASTAPYRKGWSRANAMDSHSGGDQIESRKGHQLSSEFLWSCSILSSKYGDSLCPLPSRSFLIYQSSCYPTQCSLQTKRVIKPFTKERKKEKYQTFSKLAQVVKLLTRILGVPDSNLDRIDNSN